MVYYNFSLCRQDIFRCQLQLIEIELIEGDLEKLEEAECEDGWGEDDKEEQFKRAALTSPHRNISADYV